MKKRFGKSVDSGSAFPLSECEFSVLHQPFANVGEILGYYERFRTYVQHEDDLISARLTWSLTAHGFLFTSYGLLMAKGVDLLLEMGKTPALSILLEHSISGLLFLQILVAVFGALVGWQSRLAIEAADRAIQHLFAIAEASPVLRIARDTARTDVAIAPGRNAITPIVSLQVRAGDDLLIEEGIKSRQETVRIAEVVGATITADFTLAHPAGALIRPLGTALLPKIINGGGPGDRRGARSYHFALPQYAWIAWTTLGLISLAFCYASVFYRDWFFCLLTGGSAGQP